MYSSYIILILIHRMPLLWISLAFVCGIVLAHAIAVPIAVWIGLSILGAVFCIPPIYQRIARAGYPSLNAISRRLRIPSGKFYPLMVVFIGLGAIRYQLNLPTLNPGFIAYYNDQSSVIRVVGVVTEPPDKRENYTNLRIQAEQVELENRNLQVQGSLLARIPSNTSVNYGDRLLLQGKIQTPPENEDFSYRDYLANRGIYSYLPYPVITLVETGQGNPAKAGLFSFRQRAVDQVYSLFPDPEASLIAGIILGVQTGIPARLQEAFRATGTSHIIVISGFNITIIAGVLTLLFSRLLGRYKGACMAALGIIFYTLLVGANAAVVRAAILGLLTLLGHLVGRRQAGLNSLTFAAGVMSAISPTVLWDVSFQLSFAATLGIMLYAEPMTEWFIRLASRFLARERAEKLAHAVSEYFLLTLAAQLTTLPLMVYYFNRLSLTALIANPLILPAQPALMVLGGISIFAGMIFQPIGQVFAWAAWPFTAYTIRMVEWLSTIPHGSIALGQVTMPSIILFYCALFMLTIDRRRLAGLTAKIAPTIPLAMLGIAGILIWKAAFYAPDGRMHITIFDVGTGEGVLIQSPTGRAVLINGGASTNKLSEAMGRRLPFFDRSPDWLVVADTDEEDLAGVTDNLERFQPRNVLWAGNTSGTRAAADLWTNIGNRSIPVVMMQAGQELGLGDLARMSVISVDDKGAVLWLEWQNFRMLLPMGLDAEALERLQNDTTMRNLSALVLAESGYAPANPPALIVQANPQVAMLSVAVADKAGLPSPETLQALEEYNLLRTDKNGWIEITTDGKQMWVEVEKK